MLLAGRHRSPEEAGGDPALSHHSVALVMVYGLGNGGRGESDSEGKARGVLPAALPRSSPGKAPLPAPRLPRAAGMAAPSPARFGSEVARPHTRHLPPAPSDSSGESQEVAARARQKHVCEGETEAEKVQQPRYEHRPKRSPRELAGGAVLARLLGGTGRGASAD